MKGMNQLGQLFGQRAGMRPPRAVNVTAQGRALRQPILKVWDNLEERMLANMTKTEQALLRRLLMQALANLTAGQEA